MPAYALFVFHVNFAANKLTTKSFDFSHNCRPDAKYEKRKKARKIPGHLFVFRECFRIFRVSVDICV